MRRKEPHRRVFRRSTVETLEDRVVMSADPVGGLLGGAIDHQVLDDFPVVEHDVPALEQHGVDYSAGQTPDFWLDPNVGDLDQHLYEIDETLASANALTGLTQARSDYGFIGTGQTVAVIDSGIAYDHYALGGGFGTDYRVVGGWDFTEGDADPYDDGPSGSHGTHVSGIVGGDAGTSGDSGVAPGVDLVGLRVFDDAGSGYFSWVEQALQWVHQNRNALENPITAVNLSLGTTWNSESIPSWAMLEDEFTQLEADDIFVSVSAGNSFTSYNTTGLSYPAASSHVVPVMSVDDSGLLSYFSQRSERAIAAPGRYIRSTVPDYAGNHNGVTDDWAYFSGTSMAAPYVAGASVIIREAMEFVGYTDITQQTIYDHMIDTADQFYDSATGLYYNRLNVGAAIDALIPADDFGSSVIDAYNLGTVSDTASVSGLVGKLDDVDYFTFTAGVSGTVSVSTATTHTLAAAWTCDGGDSQFEGDSFTLDVVAGQSYTVGLSTTDGLGYYDVQLALEPSATVVETLVGNDGKVYSLGSDGRLSVDGAPTWSDVRDFAVTDNNVLYLLRTSGELERRDTLGNWKTLGQDVATFDVSVEGRYFFLDSAGWVSVNGHRVWSDIDQFTLTDNNSLYLQRTDGLLQRRDIGAYWKTLSHDAVSHEVTDAGRYYVLESDGWTQTNGSPIWRDTKALALTEDQTVYWQSIGGYLARRASGGSWQSLGANVAEFAVNQNGAVYTLTGDGNVQVDGTQTWSSIASMHTDSLGNLVIESTGGTLYRRAGRFITRGDFVASPRAVTVSSETYTSGSVGTAAFDSLHAGGLGIGDVWAGLHGQPALADSAHVARGTRLAASDYTDGVDLLLALDGDASRHVAATGADTLGWSSLAARGIDASDVASLRADELTAESVSDSVDQAVDRLFERIGDRS